MHRAWQVGAIVRQVEAHDDQGKLLWAHMVMCSFEWLRFADDNPDLTVEEIASAAACGFNVPEPEIWSLPTAQAWGKTVGCSVLADELGHGTITLAFPSVLTMNQIRWIAEARERMPAQWVVFVRTEATP